MNNILAMLLAVILMFTGITVTGLTGTPVPASRAEAAAETAPAEEAAEPAEEPAQAPAEEAAEPAEAPAEAAAEPEEAAAEPAAEAAEPAEEAAEPAAPVSSLPAEKVGLPAVGDTVHGFTVKEIREFPSIGAQVVVFEHEKTGAGFVYIANDDTNRVYDLTFLTDAVDNTGLPHVFEHATLDGSKKYPSKALFFNLSYQTYNTYMNASTYDRMTTYPVASLSEEQLLKYADYYTDSCLYPMIMEDESIFNEEAWRYRLESPDAELTIEGTVYSEMLGATTLERMASKYALQVAYPGSMIGNDRGGLPSDIPNMNWEHLREYHDKYYHPSNMVAFLYGDFQDYTAFLALLDEAISPFEKREFVREDPGYTPITENVTAEFAFPVEAGSDTKNTATVYYMIVCPGAEGEEEMTLNTLTDLMGAGSSAMYQAVEKALPTASFATYIETGAPDPAIVFIAQKVNREDAATFKQVIDEQLALIAEKGFDQEFVDGVMASVSMNMMLTREAADVGTSIIPTIAYSYSSTGNIFDHMDYVDALGMMDQWNQEGRYQAAAAKWLVGSNTTALTTTYPEPGLKEQQDAAEKERLAAVKAAMTEEEIAEIVARSNAPKEEDTTASEYVKQLQAVTVATLPEEIKRYEVSDETDEAGVRHVNATASVDGIGQADVFLDAGALPQEDIHWFKLLTGLIGSLDTQNHTKEEAAVLTTRYLYNASVRMSLLDDKEVGYHPYLRMSWIGRDEDLEDGYNLMYELVFGVKLDDEQKVLDGVKALRSGVRSSIQSSPYSVQLYRALGIKNPMWRLYSYANFIEYYEFLTQVEEAMAADPAAVTAKLQSVLEFLRNNAGALVAFSGNKDSQALNAPLAAAFLAKLNHEERERVVYDLPAAAESEALAIESSVQYNAVVADFEALGLEGYDGGMDAVTNLVLDKFLYPQLRDQYGAYGVFHGAVEDGGLYVISYRDPNVLQTFQVYAQLPKMVADLEIDQATLDGYILSAYPGYAASTGELSGAVSAMLNRLENDDPEKPLQYMRQLKQVTPESLKRWGDIYANMMKNGVMSTAAGLSTINQNKQLYQVVLNPFGTKDTSQVAFADLAEDHPNYAAVRKVFEAGVMAPKAEDAFGVEEDATVGELAAGLYALVGGTRNEEEAMGFFAQYGLVNPEDVGAPLTRGAAGDLIGGLLPLLGAPVPETDGSAYADYDGSQDGLLVAMAYEIMSAAAGEEGQVLNAAAVLNRGELAETFTRFMALLQ